MISYSHFLFCALLDDFSLRKRNLFASYELIFLVSFACEKDYVSRLRHADSAPDGGFSIGDYLIFAKVHAGCYIATYFFGVFAVGIVGGNQGIIRIFVCRLAKLMPAKLRSAAY